MHFKSNRTSESDSKKKKKDKLSNTSHKFLQTLNYLKTLYT